MKAANLGSSSSSRVAGVEAWTARRLPLFNKVVRLVDVPAAAAAAAAAAAVSARQDATPITTTELLVPSQPAANDSSSYSSASSSDVPRPTPPEVRGRI